MDSKRSPDNNLITR